MEQSVKHSLTEATHALSAERAMLERGEAVIVAPPIPHGQSDKSHFQS